MIKLMYFEIMPCNNGKQLQANMFSGLIMVPDHCVHIFIKYCLTISCLLVVTMLFLILLHCFQLHIARQSQRNLDNGGANISVFQLLYQRLLHIHLLQLAKLRQIELSNFDFVVSWITESVHLLEKMYI